MLEEVNEEHEVDEDEVDEKNPFVGNYQGGGNYDSDNHRRREPYSKPYSSPSNISRRRDVHDENYDPQVVSNQPYPSEYNSNLQQRNNHLPY